MAQRDEDGPCRRGTEVRKVALLAIKNHGLFGSARRLRTLEASECKCRHRPPPAALSVVHAGNSLLLRFCWSKRHCGRLADRSLCGRPRSSYASTVTRLRQTVAGEPSMILFIIKQWYFFYCFICSMFNPICYCITEVFKPFIPLNLFIFLNSANAILIYTPTRCYFL